jgi:hypothetical protein
VSKEPDPGATPDEEEAGGPPAPTTSPKEHTLDDIFDKGAPATGVDGGLEFETDTAPASPSPSGPPDSSYDAGHDFGWRSKPQPVDDVHQVIAEAIDNIEQGNFAEGAANVPAESSPISEVPVETGVQLLSATSTTPFPSDVQPASTTSAPPPSSPRNANPLLIGAAAIVALVVIEAILLATGVFGASKSPSTGSPAATARATSTSTAASHVLQASAMIGGLGEDSRTSPAAVVCQLRGTVPGMVFHGTLAGDNIPTTNFVVTAGQPSHGRAPTSPTDGIFALEFPGTGGQLGGGPAGKMTCTITSVDVPAGYTLAPHADKDWTIEVT